MFTTIVLAISGMHCPSCAGHIDEALEQLPGVASARTDMDRSRTCVGYDPMVVDVEAMIAAVEEVGYLATSLDGDSSPAPAGPGTPDLRGKSPGRA